MHISVCANEAGSLEDFVDPPMLGRGCTARYMQNKSGTGSRAPAYPLMAGSANGKPRGCGWGSFINPVEHRKIKDV